MLRVTHLTIQIMFKHKIVHNSFTLIKMYSSGHMNLDHNEIFFAILQAITDATLLASRAARITSILNQKQSLSDVSMQSVSEPMEHQFCDHNQLIYVTFDNFLIYIINFTDYLCMCTCTVCDSFVNKTCMSPQFCRIQLCLCTLFQKNVYVIKICILNADIVQNGIFIKDVYLITILSSYSVYMHLVRIVRMPIFGS